ncbi:MAG: type II CRISPR-associated endonuclease Cas1 [Candidatus Wallbacteria bacterium HGW-Wallbacteria-1]|jgi:CRISPR-associated protein Cas1|uniref:Type II CRISPR-associated endonuclease Cas1 n=1 Tax=Candidatus Wallbacteria bacterium HGW-Wallbacteria-1 TaxID=2013854 RepID=A0A2N1PNH5_9BACT|nr:MAG: type II CRISPR-associated endonuclease Cas1 [Candidatus Wallbacteria bacterium HGW-Wallbacteria-1]
MSEIVIDISDTSADIRVDTGRLLFNMGGEEKKVALRDIGSLIISNPAVRITQAVMTGLLASGATLICCDNRHMPTGMLIPTEGNYIQGERIGLQVDCSKPRKKRLWQQTVKAKIRAQGRLLKNETGSSWGLIHLASKVASGDSNNIEGHAARIYWKRIFPELNFIRDRYARNQNRLLNYGYAVLRATMTRAICGTGLHPSLGLHHHNKYDAFRLANDLMEPYRTVIDKIVCNWMQNTPENTEVSKEWKSFFFDQMANPLTIENEKRCLMDCCTRTSFSLVQCLSGKATKLLFPKII